MTEATAPNPLKGANGNGDGHGADPLQKRVDEGPKGGARTWYDVLEVPADVSAADLKKAYDRALALVEGRSIGGYLMLDPLAAESARADVEAAYAVLGDAERRAAYDAKLRSGTGSEPPAPSSSAEPSAAERERAAAERAERDAAAQLERERERAEREHERAERERERAERERERSDKERAKAEAEAREARQLLAIEEQQKQRKPAPPAQPPAHSGGAVSSPGLRFLAPAEPSEPKSTAPPAAAASSDAKGPSAAPSGIKFAAAADANKYASETGDPGAGFEGVVSDVFQTLPPHLRIPPPISGGAMKPVTAPPAAPPASTSSAPSESTGVTVPPSVLPQLSGPVPVQPMPSPSSTVPVAAAAPATTPPAPTTPPAKATSLPESGEIGGSVIRDLREARGLTLDEVAEATKIRKPYLKAIEEEDIPNLPARVYLRGFLTQVARVLKVDKTRLADGYLMFVEKRGS